MTLNPNTSVQVESSRVAQNKFNSSEFKQARVPIVDERQLKTHKTR